MFLITPALGNTPLMAPSLPQAPASLRKSRAWVGETCILVLTVPWCPWGGAHQGTACHLRPEEDMGPWVQILVLHLTV